MAHNIKDSQKERQRNQIRMLQIKKLQEVNKYLKTDNQKLTEENRNLVDANSKLKSLMVNYEKESLYQRIESNVSTRTSIFNSFCLFSVQYIFEELAKENDNLKRLLLINHDFTDSIKQRILEIEQEEQERNLKKFKELQEL